MRYGGIGRATASALQTAGAAVVTWGRRPSADVVCDIDDEASVAAAMTRTLAIAGKPTLLVCAAGAPAPVVPFYEVTVEDFDRALTVNLRGTFLTVREFTRGFVASDGGSIVIVSSTSGVYAVPTQTSYGTSKHALSHLGRVASLDLGAMDIRVNVVCPGPTATDLLSPLLQDPQYGEDVERVTPLGRIGAPDDIATSIVNVMRSDWITGQVFAVEGGESLVTSHRPRSMGLARALTRSSRPDGQPT